MNNWDRGKVAREVAMEIHRHHPEAPWTQVSNGCIEINFSDYVIITIHTNLGFEVIYCLHEKVAQRQVSADSSLIDTAKALLNQALNDVLRRKIRFSETP